MKPQREIRAIASRVAKELFMAAKPRRSLQSLLMVLDSRSSAPAFSAARA